MNELVEIKVDDYAAGVKQFRRSVGWSYLTHRYLPAALNLLVRALTVSGLDPWEWARCALRLILRPGSTLGRLLVETGVESADVDPLPARFRRFKPTQPNAGCRWANRPSHRSIWPSSAARR